MAQIPDNLYIEEGELKSKDGRTVKDVLIEWQLKFGFKNGTAVNVVCHKNLQELEDAYISRGRKLKRIKEALYD